MEHAICKNCFNPLLVRVSIDIEQASSPIAGTGFHFRESGNSGQAEIAALSPAELFFKGEVVVKTHAKNEDDKLVK